MKGTSMEAKSPGGCMVGDHNALRRRSSRTAAVTRLMLCQWSQLG